MLLYGNVISHDELYNLMSSTNEKENELLHLTLVY